jgi:general secretion pathway protein G
MTMRRLHRFVQRPRTAAGGHTCSDQGFTLIELLIVISIVLILSAMSIAQYRNSVTLAKEAALRSDLFFMRDAIDQYYADKGKYPESLQTLVSENYIRAIPKDPITNSTDTWRTTPAEPQPGSSTTDPGIYQVTSGADLTAIDGSRYADWQ